MPELTADVDADVLRLFLDESGAITGSKKRQIVIGQDTLRILVHDKTTDTIKIGVSDDSKQALLAGAQTISGSKTFTPAQTFNGNINSNAELIGLLLTINALASQSKTLKFKSGGVERVRLEVTDAESGSNAGANIYLRTYVDAGTILHNIIKVTRSTGAMELTKLLQLAAGVTANAPLRIPHGVAPTSPVNGDIWTTTDGVYIRLNGTTYPFFKKGSYTATLTGVTTTVTGTANYTRVGNSVVLTLPELLGLSNSTACTITGMPVEIIPSLTLDFINRGVSENLAAEIGITLQTNGTLTLANGFTAGASTWINDNKNKGVNRISMSYVVV
jgi:hypothetical protein